MKNLAAILALVCVSLAVLACDALQPPPPPEKKSTCDVSLSNLSGEWVKTIPTPTVTQIDERNRVKFFTENGTPKALATMGTIDKWVMVQSEVRPRDAIYLQERDPSIIEKIKAENKDPNFRLQGKMYVRVNEQKCQVQITETYITYVDGKLVEPQTGMAVFYARTGKTYSWEACTSPRSLKYSEEPIDASKLKAATDRDPPLKRAIPSAKPGYFAVYYPDSSFKEGCTSSFDVYDEDVQVAKDLTSMVAGNGGKVFTFDRTFEPYDTGRYIEVFRYDTCAGTKALADVTCGVVKPD